MVSGGCPYLRRKSVLSCPYLNCNFCIKLRLFIMMDHYICLWIIFADKVRSFFSTVYGAVLAAGAAEIDLKMFKPSFQIIFDADGNHILYKLKKSGHFCFSLQIFLYRNITPCLRFILLYPSRIQDPAAVEGKAAAVAGSIFGNSPFFIGKAVYIYS